MTNDRYRAALDEYQPDGGLCDLLLAGRLDNPGNQDGGYMKGTKFIEPAHHITPRQQGWEFGAPYIGLTSAAEGSV
jgi:hypothetical protein